MTETVIRPLLVSTDEQKGGAAVSANRLHRGLRAQSIPSQMLVRHKQTKDTSVFKPKAVQERAWMVMSQRLEGYAVTQLDPKHGWTFNQYPNGLSQMINRFEADIVNLHFSGRGFVPIQALPHIDAPIVWTLHDMWAMTGGCRHSLGCLGYQNKCGNCPQIPNTHGNDASRKLWRLKNQRWRNLSLTIVTPSNWLAECARSSSLFNDKQVLVIPYGLDIENTYKPQDKIACRATYDLPTDKKIVLFGAVNSDTNMLKGGQYLIKALQDMALDDTVLVTIGGSTEDTTIGGVPVISLGMIDVDEMPNVFPIADMFVLPSLAENLPNMIIESFACGVPCVAFSVGGVPDLIVDGYNGYKAELVSSDTDVTHQNSVDSLAQCIDKVLQLDDEQTQQFSHNARQTAVDKYDIRLSASRYYDLYQSIVARSMR